MISFENVEVFGWQAAIRGMRNAYNSWDKSDSDFNLYFYPNGDSPVPTPSIGENDLKLMKQLSKAGNDHGKFLRMINVSFDLTAPFFWWKEFMTYSVGVVVNSCSTMHTIHKKKFDAEDFEYNEMNDLYKYELSKIIKVLNDCRDAYLREKDKERWYALVHLLPSCYKQRRTIQLNYQVLKSQYFARRNHKLQHWHDYCNWALTLPYFKTICVDVVDN